MATKAKPTNYEKFVVWAIRTGIVAVMAFCIGAMGTAVLSRFAASENGAGDVVLMMLVLGGYTALFFGALPAAVAVWFLLLHMIRQVSQAARSDDADE